MYASRVRRGNLIESGCVPVRRSLIALRAAKPERCGQFLSEFGENLYESRHDIAPIRTALLTARLGRITRRKAPANIGSGDVRSPCNTVESLSFRLCSQVFPSIKETRVQPSIHCFKWAQSRPRRPALSRASLTEWCPNLVVTDPCKGCFTTSPAESPNDPQFDRTPGRCNVSVGRHSGTSDLPVPELGTRPPDSKYRHCRQ